MHLSATDWAPARARKGQYFHRARLLTVTLLVASFGPYVSSALGLRLEHFVIYPLAIFLLVELMLRGRFQRDSSTLLWVTYLILAAAAWTLVVSVGSPMPGITFGMRVAGLENFVQPAALFLTMGLLAYGVTVSDRVALLKVAIFTFLVMLAMNAVIALATVYVDVWPLVKYFAASSVGGLTESTWERSVRLGRYCGIFNQPIEAGLAYSVGLLGWAYLVGSYRKVAMHFWLIATFIIIGGILTVSKTFLFVGLPMGIVYWSLVAGRHQVVRPRTLASVCVGVAAAGVVLSHWHAAEYAMRFLSPENLRDIDSVLGVLTAGRYVQGVESTVKLLFSEVMLNAPITGFGFGAYSTLENAYLEYIYLGGLIAFAFYLAALALLAGSAVSGRNTNMRESVFLALLLVLVLVAGLGGPVLTLNRVSVGLIVFLGLTVSIISGTRMQFHPAGTSLR